MEFDPNRPHPSAIESRATSPATETRHIDDRSILEDPQQDVLSRLDRERQAFHIITEAAVSHADLTDICQKILTDLLGVLDFDFATLRLFDPATRLLNPVAIVGQ